jgi:hypothetical protein
MTIQESKDWKRLLQDKLENTGNKKEDVQSICDICDEYSVEIGSLMRYLSEQDNFVAGIKHQYSVIYNLRFGSTPISHLNEPKKTEPKLLDNRKSRSQVIKEIALEVIKPGQETERNFTLIKELMKKRNLELVGGNPNAIISTILNGYVSEFEKVQGKKGVFKRKIADIGQSSSQVSLLEINGDSRFSIPQ